MEKNLTAEDIHSSKINSLIELMEVTTSMVPSCTHENDTNDISLFEHSKLTASIALCIYHYLDDKKKENYKKILLNNEKDFYKQKAFCLASFDISGIQNFIYSVISEKALKQLRARSNYLELVSEFLVDELLASMELTRANVIYNGGGHCYMLMPNTARAKENFINCLESQNRWFLRNYNINLYVAGGYQECNAYELQNTEGGESIKEINQSRKTSKAYKKIFSTLSQKISKQKMQRYTASDVSRLNAQEINHLRECSVCGCSVKRLQDGKCFICLGLEKLGRKIMNRDLFFVFTNKKVREELNFPFHRFGADDCFMQVLYKEETQKAIAEERIVRFYAKNQFSMGIDYGANILVGDYMATKQLGLPLTFDELAKESTGIKRLGVLRADVDDLGQAFICGFERQEAEQTNYEYTTLSRTATLSRNLAMFFKFYINEILEKKQQHSYLTLCENGNTPRSITIIYSGGDDVFMVGSYDEIIEVAYDLRESLKRFTQGTLSISAGVGMYRSRYPISRMAVGTGGLENCSKRHPQKDSITLFADDMQSTFYWDEFKEDVIDKKLKLLKQYFKDKQEFSPGNGSSFLYNLLTFLRQNKAHRVAYLLSRLVEEDQHSSLDKEFINKIYSWSKEKQERRRLIMAITLYIYLNRKREEDKNE